MPGVRAGARGEVPSRKGGVNTHQFLPHPDPRLRWQKICACELPRSNRVHEVPDRSDDDRSDEIVGEGREAETVGS